MDLLVIGKSEHLLLTPTPSTTIFIFPIINRLLEEIGIEKEGTPHQQALLLGSCTNRKVDLDSEDIGPPPCTILERFENFSNVPSTVSRFFLAGREDMEWNPATRKARLFFCFTTANECFTTIGIFVHAAAVDTVTTAARWWTNLVNKRPIRRVDLEGRDAKETIFLHAAQFLTTGCDSSLLEGAALATAKWAAEWTVDGDHLILRRAFLLDRFRLESLEKLLTRPLLAIQRLMRQNAFHVP
ncbi:hypothetical protein MHU86_22551 [Fragilaria crotonensis]|nr:hypothetical protein MHU86_22551 [Fragilaria crotonensis]